MLIICWPIWANGQDGPAGAADEPVAPEQMAKSIQNALASHSSEVKDLQAKLASLEDLHSVIQADIKAFESQNTAHNQLLLVSHLRMEELENALKNNRLATRLLTERIQNLQKEYDIHAILVQQTADLIALARKQIGDIARSQLSDDQKQALTSAARELVQVLNAKEQLAERVLKSYAELLNRMKQASTDNQAIEDKLSARLEDLEKSSLLTRYAPYKRLHDSSLAETLDFFHSRIKAFLDPAEWKEKWRQLAIVFDVRWAFVMLLLVFLAAAQGRSRRRLQRMVKKCAGPDHTYRRLSLQLLNRSLPLLSLTLLFGIYSSLPLSFLDIGLRRFLYRAFLLLLLTRWGLDFLKFGSSAPPTAVRTYVSTHMRRLLRFARPVGLAFILLTWITGMGSFPVWIAANLLGMVLLAWNVRFWRALSSAMAEGVRAGDTPPAPKRLALFKWWSYLVIGSGLLLNLFGYDMLAGHLTAAWIKTVLVLFLGWLSLQALREWLRDHRRAAASATESQTASSARHLRWALIQLVRMIWFLGLIAGIIWAWDRSGFLVSQLVQFLQLTVTVGSLRLSVKGVLLGLAFIFVTYLVTRIGRPLLDEKILEKRKLERGLKDSILTIASYLTWGLGLVLVLGSLGVNTTSLAVVFGALSIGIGFGLQNIFNNFISGLILLFERPIQVGDYVEVGGLWAEVKKITVRATVVQTFDNASVIIPNSEFISQRVTNWSFKDKRMRRNLEIGVAYGSDIELVQTTLLDIALESAGVLQDPSPDVIFIDHADSALIFRLRIWVHVDDYFKVPSRIRSEIDRRFRQLGIEIAFPQRDLHIRTLPKEAKAASSVKDTLVAQTDSVSEKEKPT
jgi:small-conductance mechanosensitive channel